MRRPGILLISLVLVAAACSDAGSVFGLSVGDCFNTPETNEISRVEVVECDTSHDHEVYLLFDITDGDFPGATAIASQASDTCLSGFDDYVGIEYADSALDIGFLPPSEASWDNGDREVVCYLFDFNGAKLTTGAKDSAF